MFSRKTSFRRIDWVFVSIIATIILLYALLPIGTALEFGGDEGIELMKGLLVSKGYSLYKDIWNDQPPVFTMLLSMLFRMFGPSILAARLLAVSFGFLLFVTVYCLVRFNSKRLAAALSVLFLASAPGMFQLSCSAMLEVPAIATALLSAFFVFLWQDKRHLAWLAISGLLMGTAMQIKLTAVLVAPAICLQILSIALKNRGKTHPVAVERSPQIRVNRSVYINRATGLFVKYASSWCLVMAATFLVIGMLFGRGSLISTWRSHTGRQTIPELGSVRDFPFDAKLLVKNAECVAGATFALILVPRQRRHELQFPLAMLVVCLLIHAFHRPWWSYYYLHIAVPLAWLSAIGFSEVLRKLINRFSISRGHNNLSKWLRVGALSCVVSIGAVVSEMRLEGNIRKLRELARTSDDQIVRKMREYASSTHWVYSQRAIYPFHAGLCVPPELAVVVLKRFWSGQITSSEVIDICRRYEPDQLVLRKSRISREWIDLLDHNYVQSYEDENSVLYVARGKR